MLDLNALNAFVVEAKAATYVGGGEPMSPCRRGAHNIGYRRGGWRYLDSYFGGTDFAGQEVIWLDEVAIWAMNSFGRIVEPTLIDAEGAGTVIKAALSRLYATEQRFWGRATSIIHSAFTRIATAAHATISSATRSFSSMGARLTNSTIAAG